MIRWLLERISRDPNAVFEESELTQSFPSEFAIASRGGLLKPRLLSAGYTAQSKTTSSPGDGRRKLRGVR